MHLILKKHVDELATDFDLVDDKESKLFEFFCNFCVVSKKFLGRFNPKEITTEEDDASIDGLGIIIDGDLVLTQEDASGLFSRNKSNLQVDIIITQVKSGENFEKDEISNFKLGIDDFLSLEPKLPNGNFNIEMLEIIKIIFDNLKKIRNRRPNIFIYYCTS